MEKKERLQKQIKEYESFIENLRFSISEIKIRGDGRLEVYVQENSNGFISNLYFLDDNRCIARDRRGIRESDGESGTGRSYYRYEYFDVEAYEPEPSETGNRSFMVLLKKEGDPVEAVKTLKQSFLSQARAHIQSLEGFILEEEESVREERERDRMDNIRKQEREEKIKSLNQEYKGRVI